MLPERWQKLEEVFDAAVDLTEDQQRAYLDEVCANDPEMRVDLDHMLGLAPESARSSIGNLIQSAIGEAAESLSSEPGADPMIGSFLGPYRIASMIGRGGMGAVYRAVREDDQFRKEVAIKVIPRVLAGPDGVARFRAERQILANLEHPNIARLLDGGTAEGIPYLVMEYIEGVPITKYVTDKNLSIPERLRLVRSVCSAVQYAHSKLVVHRDLKPANILVSADGVVKLLDFGVAKLLDPSAIEASHTSAMLMTPDYASPEQIRGEAVTTTGDVYSLGIVLYEVLTGERPYRVTGQSPLEMERLICLTEPRRPSDVEIVPRRLRRTLTGDLDNIVLMALRKDASRRYQSAEHLAEDIRRYLEGKPVQARPDTFWYRSGKFVQRHRWALAAAAIVSASLIGAVVISLQQARVARNRFDQLRGFARTVLVDLNGQLADIPGTANARKALIAHVNDYLKKMVADNAEDDKALATEVATTFLRLGEMQGNTPGAIESFENGRRLLEQKRQRGVFGPGDALTLARLRLRLGMVSMDLGKVAEGKEHLLAAADIAGGEAPNLEAVKIKARANWRLGRMYRTQYKLSDAERHASLALTACEQLVATGTQDRELDEIYTGARLVLGGVYRRQGRWDLSFKTYSEGLAYSQKRADENPASVGMQRELALTHQILADMLSQVPGQAEAVRVHVRSSTAIAEKLAAPDPTDMAAQQDLGQALSLGAETLVLTGDFDESVRYLQRAVPIFQALLAREPDSGVFLLYAGLTEAELGDSLGHRNPDQGSIQRIRNGLALLEKVAAREPANTTHLIEVLKIKRMLASNLARASHEAEALHLSIEMIDTARRIAADPGSRTALPLRELPRALASMGDVQTILGRPGEARKWYASSAQEWDALRAAGHVMPDSEPEAIKVRRLAQNP